LFLAANGERPLVEQAQKGTSQSPNSCPVCLIGSVFGHPELLLSAQKSTCNSVRRGGLNRGCAKQANDPTLSSSFVDCDRLSVRIQCDSARSMTQQLLHYLDICFSCRQQGRIRMPERMPSDVLCDSDLHRSGADKTPHDSLSPIRFFAGRSGTRKHPIIWFSVRCVLPPCPQRFG